MRYCDVRDEITTGSLVGALDENGGGWVGVVVRGEDLFHYYGQQRVEAAAEMAGRVLVVFDPGPGASWPAVRTLSRVLRRGPTLVRVVAEAPPVEAIDGLLLAVAVFFRVPASHLPGGLVSDLLTPPDADFAPADGGELATTIWQNMGFMLPPPHGPDAGQMTAKQLLDVRWGPPQVTDIALEDPMVVEGE